MNRLRRFFLHRPLPYGRHAGRAAGPRLRLQPDDARAYGGVERPFTFENYTRSGTRCMARCVAVVLDRGGGDGAVPGAAFPLALFIARSGARKNLYLSLVILPFWTSFLIRTYAWMFLLARYRPDQHAASGAGRDPRPAAAAVQQRRGDPWAGVRIPALHGAAPVRDLERMDPSLAEARPIWARVRFRHCGAWTLPLCAPAFAPDRSWCSSLAWERI